MGYYKAMKDTLVGNKVSNYADWDSKRLGAFFEQHGLGKYSSLIKEHKITGRLAPLLSDDDLKEMGITVVGDRLMFRHHLKVLSREARFVKRTLALWEGEEQIFFSPTEKKIFTAYGMCPVDPTTYKLTVNHLKVKRVQPVRCGPIRLCCFGATYIGNNIDLSKVDDVDVIGVPAPCWQRVLCCAKGKDLVEVESRFAKTNKVTLTLEEGRGEKLVNLILNQVEESQKMERC